MQEFKIGDEVLVRLKILEIRETLKGKKYKAQLPSDNYEMIVISPKDIKESLSRWI